MSTCFRTHGQLTIKQIENDENLKINYSSTDKTKFNVSLADNDNAFAIPYGEDNFNYYKVRTDEALLLFKYLFEKYDLYFVDEDYDEESFYVPNYAHSAFWWKLTTDYMLGICDWNDECKARIEEKRNEWLPHYEFYEKYINATKLIEIDELLNKVFGEEQILESELNKIERFVKYIFPIFTQKDYGIPETLLTKIDNGINDLKESIEKSEIKIIYPEKSKENTISNNELPF